MLFGVAKTYTNFIVNSMPKKRGCSADRSYKFIQ